MPKRGEPASESQRAALKRGQAKRTKQLKDRPKDEEGARERWSKLLDGSLTVGELTDEEIKRKRVHGPGGVFTGSPPRMPSHLDAQFQSEQLKRAKSQIRKGLPSAIRTMTEIANDPEHKDQFRAAQWLAEHSLGKAPETVNIKTDDHWGKLLGEALDVDRELRDLDR